MAKVRVTVGGIGGKFVSRTPGDPTGVAVNTFGLDKLQAGLTGEALAEITLDAAQPALEQAQEDWPRLTGASGDTIDLVVTEIGDHHARVALQAGGQRLIDDPRNKSKKDYAPFIEFNGTATTPPGTLTHALIANDPAMRAKIHAAVKAYIQDLLS